MMSDNLKTWPEKMYFQHVTDESDEQKPVPEYPTDLSEEMTHCSEQIYSNDVEYIRADLVNEREAKLLRALKDARLTIDDYAPHAGEYLMKKYRLEENLKDYDTVIAEFEGSKL